MARPRSFDETQAVRDAVQVFWSNGYPATGVRELCEAMGIQSGSFYASFGSKSSLFVRAVGQYVHDLGLPDPSPAAARAYLERIAAERSPTGCLLAISAAERHALEPDGQQAVVAQVRRLERWLGACLQNRAPVDATRDARLLATMAWGLQVQHRAGVSPTDLRGRVDHLAGLLELPPMPR